MPTRTSASLRFETDERLVELCRDASAPGMQAIAQEAIVERYREPLLRYCTRFMGRSDAEDIVQLTFERTLPVLLDPGRQLLLKPWLYRVTHNLAINQMSLKRAVPSDTLETNGDESPAPEVELERSQRITGLVRDIQALPERQRAALLMRDFEGRSYEDVAEALDSNTANARKLTQLARKRLRDGLGVLFPAPLLSGLWRRLEVWLGKSGPQLAGTASAVAPIAAVVVLGAGVAVSVDSAAGKRSGPSAPSSLASQFTGGDRAATQIAAGASPLNVDGVSTALGTPAGLPPIGPQSIAPSRIPASTAATIAAVPGSIAPLLIGPTSSDPRTALQKKRDAVVMERGLVRERRGEVRTERELVRAQRERVAAERELLKGERRSLAETRKTLTDSGVDRRSARQQLQAQRERIAAQRKRVAAERRQVAAKQKGVQGRQRDVHQQQKNVHQRQRDVVKQQKENASQRNEAAQQRRQAPAQQRHAAAQQRQAAAQQRQAATEQRREAAQQRQAATEQRRQAAAEQRAQKKAARQGSTSAPESPQT